MARFSIEKRSLELPIELWGKFSKEDKLAFIPTKIKNHYAVVKSRLGLSSKDGIRYRGINQKESNVFGDIRNANITFAFNYKKTPVIKLNIIE